MKTGPNHISNIAGHGIVDRSRSPSAMPADMTYKEKNRQQRLSEALRSNLNRRKAQKRAIDNNAAKSDDAGDRELTSQKRRFREKPVTPSRTEPPEK
ncbi:MAG: hypothetical protein AAFW47_00970 [Pseudomonadota bacterium]